MSGLPEAPEGLGCKKSAEPVEAEANVWNMAGRFFAPLPTCRLSHFCHQYIQHSIFSYLSSYFIMKIFHPSSLIITVIILIKSTQHRVVQGWGCCTWCSLGSCWTRPVRLVLEVTGSCCPGAEFCRLAMMGNMMMLMTKTANIRNSMSTIPIGSMYGIYGIIYHQYTPNVSIYSIHGFYGIH